MGLKLFQAALSPKHAMTSVFHIVDMLFTEVRGRGILRSSHQALVGGMMSRDDG
jgi:hypothetical protein